MQNPILFISHNAGRTGAPLMLLNLLKWLNENTDLTFEILLRGPGSLQEEFASIAPTSLYEHRGAAGSLIARASRKLGFGDYHANRHHRHLLSRFRKSGIELIYSNTITNGDILETLAPLGCPVLTHVHELDYWIEQSGRQNLEQVLKYSSRFIAASGAVKVNLVGKYNIAAEKIDVVHSFIPACGVTADPSGIRQKLGIPEEAFMVLGSGHETWRKGKDLFVQLAAQMQKTLPTSQTHLLWVGGWQREEDRRNVLHDVQNLGLTGRVHFTGEVSNPLDYFAAGDVFAMVSREDPFPLVCLEAAALGKPVLCFAGSGGMPEFIEEDAGFVVPYLDLPAMAERITALAVDIGLRIRLGKRAAEKVCEMYDIAAGSKQVDRIIRGFFHLQSG
jgi:glycosyltransferase involved in cell wall biosynthesis